MISKSDAGGTTQFAWDFENRLTQVVTPSAGSATYEYDALGRRIQRVPNTGASTNFTYDGDDVVKDISSDGSTVEYLNGPGIDNKIRQKGSTSSTTYYFAQDHLGSTTALTGTTGKLVERITYDAYGNSVGSTRTRYGFTGRERDPLTGVTYYRARFYDPQLGRFISEDPIGLAEGINQFAYVGNNPPNSKDPFGLYNIDVHYYLTYFIASRFPCLTPEDARQIAEATQRVDEDAETMPRPGWNEGQRQINSDFHAFNAGNNGNLANLRNIAFGSSGSAADLGRYLHYLQDSFSHQGFSNSWIGQAGSNGTDLPLFGRLVVDNTNHDVGKAAEMAGATWFAIRDWIKAKKCKCGDQGDTDVHSWWPMVIQFLETDNGELEKKRLLLGVPLR